MTDNIQEIHFDSIVFDLKAGNVKQIYQTLSRHINRLIGTPEKVLFDHLMDSEKEGTAGIGNGVAIPHMRLPRLTNPFIIFVKLAHEVDFKANDDLPVDMVCMVLSPEFEGPKHLARLSQVTRLFNQKEFCDRLRNAQDKDDVRQVVKDLNSRKIAA